MPQQKSDPIELAKQMGATVSTDPIELARQMGAKIEPQPNRPGFYQRTMGALGEAFDPTPLIRSIENKGLGGTLSGITQPFIQGMRKYGPAGLPLTAADIVAAPFMEAGKEAIAGQIPEALGHGLGAGIQVGLGALNEATPNIARQVFRGSMTPEEQAAVNWGMKNLPPKTVDLATQTGSRAAQATRDLIKNIPGSAGIIQAGKVQQEQALMSFLERIKTEIAPTGGADTALIAGGEAQKKLVSKINEADSLADQSYTTLRQIAQSNPQIVPMGTRETFRGIAIRPTIESASVAGPVNISNLQKHIDPIIREIEGVLVGDLEGIYKTAAQTQLKQASPAYAILKQIQGMKEVIPLDVADRLAGQLKGMARNPRDLDSVKAAMRNRSEGLAANAIPQLEKSISEATAKLGRNAMDSLIKGREATKRKYLLNDFLNSLGEDPTTVYSRLASKSKPEDLIQLKQLAPEAIPDIATTVLDGLIQRHTVNGRLQSRGALKDWTTINPSTKRILFGDKAEDITNALRLADMMKFDVNPSGTAPLSALMTTVGGLGTAATALLTGHPQVAASIAAPIGLGVMTSRRLAKMIYNGTPLFPRSIAGAPYTLGVIGSLNRQSEKP